MRPFALLSVALAVVLAGCSAQGQQDPFAYTKKPLYTSHFDLAPLAEGKTDSQQFRVEDGSIAQVRVQAWVNATMGSARIDVIDPSGKTVVSSSETVDQSFPLELGVWTVVVHGEPDASGQLAGGVGVLVTRR